MNEWNWDEWSAQAATTTTTTTAGAATATDQNQFTKKIKTK